MVVLEYIYNMFISIFTNGVIIAPMIAWITAQILKTIINCIVNKKIDWTRMFGDGGMPSAHSATVTALAIVIGDVSGFDSPIFGLAIMFASVVMHDALGVRREAGKQAVAVLRIADVLKNYFEEHDMNLKTEKLKVLVGHTPTQVVCGSLWGLFVAAVYIVLRHTAFGIPV